MSDIDSLFEEPHCTPSSWQPSREEAMLDAVVWLAPNDEGAARTVATALFFDGKPKSVELSHRAPKLGTMLRYFDDQSTLGVRGREHVSWAVRDRCLKTVATFGTEAEADAAYEERELHSLKTGNIITRVQFVDP